MANEQSGSVERKWGMKVREKKEERGRSGESGDGSKGERKKEKESYVKKRM